MSSDENLLSQRTVWGMNPQVVETLIAEHEREVASYRSRIADMEARISVISSQRDEALRRTTSEHIVAHSQVAELESRLSIALAQAKASEEELAMLRESADRINMLREEAVQVVADAWAMAQAIEERAQQLVQRTRTELMNEATKMRAQFEDERARHQAEMERLGKQRMQMLMQLEATARGLLDHATLIKGGEAAPGLTSTLDLALRTLNPDSAASDASHNASPAPEYPHLFSCRHLYHCSVAATAAPSDRTLRPGASGGRRHAGCARCYQARWMNWKRCSVSRKTAGRTERIARATARDPETTSCIVSAKT